MPYSLPEWGLGDDKITLRALTFTELETLKKFSDEGGDARRGVSAAFALIVGDSIGNRIYADTDSDYDEIQKSIPQRVLSKVVQDGIEFTNDSQKKS